MLVAELSIKASGDQSRHQAPSSDHCRSMGLHPDVATGANVSPKTIFLCRLRQRQMQGDRVARGVHAKGPRAGPMRFIASLYAGFLLALGYW